MRHLNLTFLLAAISLSIQGQNIVANGSFEDITSCPHSPGEVYKAPPWGRSIGSPDLFNRCNTDSGIWNQYSVPFNKFGWQEPRTGNGYVGIGTYVSWPPGYFNAHEFIKCPLNYALVQGEEYYVQFYVSLSDSSNYATHNIGVTFTDVDTSEYGELICWPTSCSIYYDNNSSNPLLSRTEWMKISGTFIANGGEKYFHLGNLRTDDIAEIEFLGDGGSGGQFTWDDSGYYVDDVWLSHIDSANYVGIEHLEKQVFDFHPNPTNTTTQFTLPSTTRISSIFAVDLTGRRIKLSCTSINSVSFEVDVSSLSSGIYTLAIEGENGNVTAERLIVQH